MTFKLAYPVQFLSTIFGIFHNRMIVLKYKFIVVDVNSLQIITLKQLFNYFHLFSSYYLHVFCDSLQCHLFPFIFSSYFFGAFYSILSLLGEK